MHQVSIVNPASLYDPRPNGYSHVAVVAEPQRLVFVAGQGGEDVNGELPAEFAEQLQRALANVSAALQAVDAQVSQVVKLTVLVVDHSEPRLAVLSAALRGVWGDEAPTCTLIPVPRLALDGMLVEIEALEVG
jgi:enamine deaminase RidA (YjgF/YER057c/UK114 family)